MSEMEITYNRLKICSDSLLPAGGKIPESTEEREYEYLFQMII